MLSFRKTWCHGLGTLGDLHALKVSMHSCLPRAGRYHIKRGFCSEHRFDLLFDLSTLLQQELILCTESLAASATSSILLEAVRRHRMFGEGSQSGTQPYTLSATLHKWASKSPMLQGCRPNRPHLDDSMFPT
jgi:hypothetical protein